MIAVLLQSHSASFSTPLPGHSVPFSQGFSSIFQSNCNIVLGVYAHQRYDCFHMSLSESVCFSFACFPSEGVSSDGVHGSQ